MAKTPRSRKQKGKKFEQQVAQFIHEWFLRNNPRYRKLIAKIGNNKLLEHLVLPNRDYASGSSARHKADINLGLLYKFFPYLIETKKWEKFKLDIFQLFERLKTRKCELLKILEDTAQKAEYMTKRYKTPLYPLVVFSANRRGSLVIFYVDKLDFGGTPADLCRTNTAGVTTLIDATNKVGIMELEDFLTLRDKLLKVGKGKD
jgi:hypothetical protein